MTMTVMTKITQRYLLRTAVTVCSKYTNVDADNGYDHTEQNKDGHLADKSDSDKHRNEHDNKQATSIDTIVVECVGRHGYVTKNRSIRNHIFLHTKMATTKTVAEKTILVAEQQHLSINYSLNHEFLKWPKYLKHC